MDDRKPDAMTDEALDRELQAALGVQPSPEFVARVRTQIASGNHSRTWQLRSPWLLAASVLAGVVVVVLQWQATRGDVAVSAPNGVAVANRPSISVDAPAVSANVAQRQSERPVERVRQRRPAMVRRLPVDRELASKGAADVAVAREPVMPEVLVSEDERRALAWLVNQARGRQVDRPVTVPPPAVEMNVPEVAIAPLAIEALPQLARLE